MAYPFTAICKLSYTPAEGYKLSQSELLHFSYRQSRVKNKVRGITKVNKWRVMSAKS